MCMKGGNERREVATDHHATATITPTVTTTNSANIVGVEEADHHHHHHQYHPHNGPEALLSSSPPSPGRPAFIGGDDDEGGGEKGSCDGGTDLLERFPAEVVFLIEMCLPVHSLIGLSAVSRDWRMHMSESHWHQIFDARWSHCYESKCLTVSPSILSRLSGNYNSFWCTIEKAFMGDHSVLGDGDGTPSPYSESLFEKFFKLLQPSSDGPPSASSSLSLRKRRTSKRKKSSPPSTTSTAHHNNSRKNKDSTKDNSDEEEDEEESLLPSWKLACVLRDRSGSSVLMGCRLCSQLDVFPPHMRELEHSCPTQLRTWVVPCLCPSLVHRRCLEAQLLLKTDGAGAAAAPGTGRTEAEGAAAAGAPPSSSSLVSSLFLWCFPPTSSSWSWLLHEEEHGGGGDGGGGVDAAGATKRGWISYDSAPHDELPADASLGICEGCGAFYRLGFRLPTGAELIWVTWNDRLAWRRAGDCVMMWVAGIAIVALSEALYQGRGDLLSWPAEGGHLLFWWMFQYVISLNIFLSPRFARVVDLLWLGPIFSFYAKLYMYFLLATTFVVATFTPLPLRLFPFLFPSTTNGRFPLWWIMLGGVNVVVLAVITSIVIFLFWKTNYRIITVADRRQNNQEDGALDEHPMLSIGNRRR